MALKDLTAQKSVLTEEAIEEIIADYIRYDTDDKYIMLTAEGAKLPNKSKILVFIVALQGWPFVTDEAVPTDVKPGDLEEKLGIPGGTLRPILMDLKDRYLLVARSGRYSVRTASLESIKDELKGGSAGASKPKAARKTKQKISADDKKGKAEKSAAGGKKSGGKSVRIPEWISRWTQDGFFNEPKALAEVQTRFHELGMIVPQHRLSTPMKKTVTPELDKPAPLKRVQHDVNGKKVWVYMTNK